MGSTEFEYLYWSLILNFSVFFKFYFVNHFSLPYGENEKSYINSFISKPYELSWYVEVTMITTINMSIIWRSCRSQNSYWESKYFSYHSKGPSIQSALIVAECTSSQTCSSFLVLWLRPSRLTSFFLYFLSWCQESLWVVVRVVCFPVTLLSKLAWVGLVHCRLCFGKIYVRLN